MSTLPIRYTVVDQSSIAPPFSEAFALPEVVAPSPAGESWCSSSWSFSLSSCSATRSGNSLRNVALVQLVSSDAAAYFRFWASVVLILPNVAWFSSYTEYNSNN